MRNFTKTNKTQMGTSLSPEEKYKEVIEILTGIKDELKQETLSIDLLDSIELCLTLKRELLDVDGFYNLKETEFDSKLSLLQILKNLEEYLENYEDVFEIESKYREPLIGYIVREIAEL